MGVVVSSFLLWWGTNELDDAGYTTVTKKESHKEKMIQIQVKGQSPDKNEVNRHAPSSKCYRCGVASYLLLSTAYTMAEFELDI